jgi:hypothetical protein
MGSETIRAAAGKALARRDGRLPKEERLCAQRFPQAPSFRRSTLLVVTDVPSS